MGFFKKLNNKKIREIGEYSILEKYDIDLNENIDLIEKIGENNKYVFYSYTPRNNVFKWQYILRQNKENLKDIVYFGNKPTYTCLFEEFLFCANGKGEMDRYDHITAINAENGQSTIFKWLGENGNYIYINGYGRPYNQDTITNMYTKENQLIIDIHREKGNIYNETDRNYEMNYTIKVKYDSKSFVPTYFYNKKCDNNYIEEKEESKISKNEKVIDDTCTKIFNSVMTRINDINTIMTVFGARELIEQDTDSFIMKTFLVCMYFYMINLKKNDMFDGDIRNQMFSVIIDEMCKRSNSSIEIADKEYIKIRDFLDKIAEETTTENPLMRASVAYIEILFSGNFDIDKLNDEEFSKLLSSLSLEFQKIINDDLKKY